MISESLLDNYLRIAGYRRDMDLFERETLLADLVGSYITCKKSDCMEFLMAGKFEEFRAYVKYMNIEGQKILDQFKEENET